MMRWPLSLLLGATLLHAGSAPAEEISLSDGSRLDLRNGQAVMTNHQGAWDLFAGHPGGTEADMDAGGYHYAALKGTSFMAPQVIADIIIRGKHSVFYFPLVSCLVISVVLSLVLWLINRR